jgi:hypothetical protein|tara:strand:+ start:504 stop:746 length:243 start_codon:yes stop_codon:yes gene_type:complete
MCGSFGSTDQTDPVVFTSTGWRSIISDIIDCVMPEVAIDITMPRLEVEYGAVDSQTNREEERNAAFTATEFVFPRQTKSS